MRRTAEGRRFSLSPMANGTAVTVGRMTRQPITAVSSERKLCFYKRRVVLAQMARCAAIDTIDILEPNLVDSADKRGEVHGMRILQPPLQLFELRLSCTPGRHVFLQEHPRKNSQEGNPQKRES